MNVVITQGNNETLARKAHAFSIIDGDYVLPVVLAIDSEGGISLLVDETQTSNIERSIKECSGFYYLEHKFTELLFKKTTKGFEILQNEGNGVTVNGRSNLNQESFVKDGVFVTAWQIGTTKLEYAVKVGGPPNAGELYRDIELYQ